MKTYFNIAAGRKILESSAMVYTRPEPHPSRKAPAFHDFVYMVEGEWSFEVYGRTYKVVPGDVFILPAGSVYNGAGDCSAGTRTYFIHTEAKDHDHPEDAGDTAPVGECIPLDTVIHCQDEPAVRALFSEIALTFSSDAPAKENVILALWKATVCMLGRCEQKNLFCKNNFVTRCVEILNEHRGVMFKEAEMAEKLFISVKTLRNGFVRHFNKTFYKYQLDYKLNLAQIFIKEDPDAKVYEVAFSLGFRDEFHFSKLFKKKFGLSPSEYRKSLQ